MNKANLKSYAPQARKDFIAAVTARANQLGLSNKAGSLEVAPAQTQGDVTVIAGQAWPAKIKGQRDKLIDRIQKDGFDYTLEAVAYTWFNRFAALRYMEIHDYLGHGHRALSSTAGGLPDILANATDLASELPGLNAAKVIELKLAGNRDGELYRMLLVAQCNALSRAMPFLFERIDDDSELLLPDNLLRSDSVITKLVNEIPEDDWAEVEIIGWLYQFYISEKKDQVIGKVVKSEDIPAATQLFTPNWIVQYLVQNSVGRLWLMANPQSPLVKEWPYYITPAEQTPEVQAQLDALIQTRVKEDGDTLNPESITVLDPACGSGHILVVAYDVLKAIYLERGYQPRSIPRLILEKNLFGLDIDDRAAQMASFALLMKARADDRRLFSATDEDGNLLSLKLNVLSLQESKGLNVDDLANSLAPYKIDRAAVALLVEAFEHAKTFGSLIQISQPLSQYLAFLPEALSLAKNSGDIYASAAADDLLRLVLQAQLLAMQFDAVVANPPYMGIKFYCPDLKIFVNSLYHDAKADLYGAFTIRNIQFAKRFGSVAMITIPSWMFLSSFEALRNLILRDAPISSLVHNGRGVWGSDFGSCAYILQRSLLSESVGRFLRLFDKQGSVASNEELQRRFYENLRFSSSNAEFTKIPGSPIAYWASKHIHDAFLLGTPLKNIAKPKLGMRTGNNEKFVRFWPEVSIQKTGLNFLNAKSAKSSTFKWFPYKKGGEFRKWYGNNDHVVNWENDGFEIKTDTLRVYPQLTWDTLGWKISNEVDFFNPCLEWSRISASYLGVRYCDAGFIFDTNGSFAAAKNDRDIKFLIGFLCSKVSHFLAGIINPSIAFQPGDLAVLPVLDFENNKDTISKTTDRAIEISREDWNSSEKSWEFRSSPLIAKGEMSKLLAESWLAWERCCDIRVSELKILEEKNNSIFINIYGLQDELSPEVPESQITLTRAERESDCQRLISYAIGCMMGRYSLDEPGLIYAHADNIGFESDRYKTFPADADGIVPITDELWFDDDASVRIRTFLLSVWGSDTLEENMAWLADSLGTKAHETPDETIRRYIANKFFSDHLQTYKKHPIYWLFSSGKQGAFQALVYLHRYSEVTLARLRAEYVVPLTSKVQNRIEMLVNDALAASSTAARNKLNKEVEALKKKHVELLAYDEKLRHYADMRITLDLDDGVKVNYGKFGDLLAEVKAVTGGASDD
jgi:type II restriction/modification system DNA methylase subunit YeeA